jgi:hypothetical protein
MVNTPAAIKKTFLGALEIMLGALISPANSAGGNNSKKIVVRGLKTGWPPPT